MDPDTWTPIPADRLDFRPYDAEISVRCPCGASFTLWEGADEMCERCGRTYRVALTLTGEMRPTAPGWAPAIEDTED